MKVDQGSSKSSDENDTVDWYSKKKKKSAKEDEGIKKRKLGSNTFDKFQIKPFLLIYD